MTKEALTSLGLAEEQVKGVIDLFDKTETDSEKQLKAALEDALNETRRLNAVITERDKQLEQLKDAAGLTESLKEELKKAIAKNKEDAEKAEAAIAAHKKESAIDMQLIKSGAKNVKAVKALINLDAVNLTETGVSGLKEQLEEVRKTDGYLFAPVARGVEPYGGAKEAAEEYKNNPFKKESFNLTEQGRIARENPELARRLKMAAGNNN